MPARGPKGFYLEVEFALTGSFWAPRAARVYAGSELYADYVIETDPLASHYQPVRIENTIFRGGTPVFRSVESNFELTPLRTAEEISVIDMMTPSVIVSEYRFERPIAYVLGFRPPTDSELVAMVKDDQAIRAYQVATGGMPYQPRSSRELPAWGLLLMATLVLAPGLVWLIKRRRG